MSSFLRHGVVCRVRLSESLCGRVCRVSPDRQTDDSYLQLPVSVFVPAVLSFLAIVICCLSCCLRCCGCCDCCLATREHQSLLNGVSAPHQSQRKSTSLVETCPVQFRRNRFHPFNTFNASCSKMLLFEGLSAILV